MPYLFVFLVKLFLNFVSNLMQQYWSAKGWKALDHIDTNDSIYIFFLSFSAPLIFTSLTVPQGGGSIKEKRQIQFVSWNCCELILTELIWGHCCQTSHGPPRSTFAGTQPNIFKYSERKIFFFFFDCQVSLFIKAVSLSSFLDSAFDLSHKAKLGGHVCFYKPESWSYL